MAAKKQPTLICDEPGCGREIRPVGMAAHKAAHRRRAADEATTSGAGGGSAPAAGAAFTDTDTEAAPREPKPRKSIQARLWGKDDDDKAGAVKPAAPRAPAGKRESAADVLALVIGGAGTALMQSGAGVPVGRVLQWEAGVAGDVIDRALAGSMLDRVVLQRLAGKKMRDGQDLAAVVMLPVIVAAVERSPELATPLKPLAEMAMRRCLIGMVPLMKKAEAEEARWREALSDLDVPEGVDLLDQLWQSIFADVAPAEPAPASANGAASSRVGADGP